MAMPETSTSQPDDSSSKSGIRPRISLRDLQRASGERVTVVFHGALPTEGLVQFIRRHANSRLGTQPVTANVASRDGKWIVTLRLSGVAVTGTDDDAFVAAVRAFDLLP
jgi:hypothetical protein